MDNTEKTKIITLLKYWIEHNKEHGVEIVDWAEKVRLLGEDEACEQMLKAVKDMDKANELLTQALKKLA